MASRAFIVHKKQRHIPVRPARLSEGPESRGLGANPGDSRGLQRMGVLSQTMRLLAASIVFALLFAPALGQSPRKKPRLLVTVCANDGVFASVAYSEERIGERIRITRVGDAELQPGYEPSHTESPTFWVVQQGVTISSFTVEDMYTGNIWVAVDQGGDRFALTYSDEGIGGDVRVFQIRGDVVTDVSNSVLQTAVADFRSRHYCQARGNTVRALKWIKGDLLLTTAVYPTGDCGSDAGHMEAYRASVPDGAIREHLTLDQLERYPGVCLENVNN